MTFMTFHILGIIIPTDFHIFLRDRSTTNQLVNLFPMRRRFPGFMSPTTRLRDKMPAQEHTYPLVNVYITMERSTIFNG